MTKQDEREGALTTDGAVTIQTHGHDPRVLVQMLAGTGFFMDSFNERCADVGWLKVAPTERALMLRLQTICELVPQLPCQLALAAAADPSLLAVHADSRAITIHSRHSGRPAGG